MSTKKYNVLFLCMGNSALSIIAEAILNHSFPNKFIAYSAGAEPTSILNQNAISLLQTMKIDTENLYSKNWYEFEKSYAPEIDFVFTLCNDINKIKQPQFKGSAYHVHWGINDPALLNGTNSEIAAAFTETYRMLNNRISAFANLPLTNLSGLSMEDKMHEISDE